MHCVEQQSLSLLHIIPPGAVQGGVAGGVGEGVPNPGAEQWHVIDPSVGSSYHVLHSPSLAQKHPPDGPTPLYCLVGQMPP